MDDAKVKDDDEEDTEQASEEKPSFKWLPWLFWGLFALAWILRSMQTGDWTYGLDSRGLG